MSRPAFGADLLMIAFLSACSIVPVETKSGNMPTFKNHAQNELSSEFRQCLSQLEMQSSQTAALRDELQRKGVMASAAWVVLEVTSSGWGGHNYSFLWIDETGRGRMGTNMVTGKWGRRIDRTFPAPELTRVLEDVLSRYRPIRDSNNKIVDDGPCFFVKMKDRSGTHGFTAYAPHRGSQAIETSERILDRLIGLIDAVAQGPE